MKNDYAIRKYKMSDARTHTDRRTYMLCEMNLLRATLVIPLLLKLSNMLEQVRLAS